MTPASQPLSVNAEAFAFVKQLAAELSSDPIELASFPEVVTRIRKALADERVRSEEIARLVAAEPALAARVLTLANSAALNPEGTRVNGLPAAIARLGVDAVRSASMAFAFEQIAKAAEFQGIASELQALWQRSVLIAALSHAAARRFTTLNADAAMLAGLLQGVGRLYILTRASRHPRLFASASAYHEIERDWHADIARALLESWDMPEEIVRAVHEAENTERELRGAVNLTDVLSVAILLASYHGEPDALELGLQAMNAASRLKLTRADCELVIGESAGEVAELRRTLGE